MSKISIDEIVLIIGLLGSFAMSLAIFLFKTDASLLVKFFSVAILWIADGLCVTIYTQDQPIGLRPKIPTKMRTHAKVPAD